MVNRYCPLDNHEQAADLRERSVGARAIDRALDDAAVALVHQLIKLVFTIRWYKQQGGGLRGGGHAATVRRLWKQVDGTLAQLEPLLDPAELRGFLPELDGTLFETGTDHGQL